MKAPNKLLFTTDGNEAELKREIVMKTNNLYEYVFTKSKTKLGMIMTYSLEILEKEIRRGVVKSI